METETKIAVVSLIAGYFKVNLVRKSDGAQPTADDAVRWAMEVVDEAIARCSPEAPDGA